MQPPIALGTVLQNRYCLIKILGQGGMARTYLGEDRGRFNELCALKELIPAQTGNYVLEKSKELFQREATILYKIQHPQIPQFRATFEEEQRLFLVQDYVEGKTYHTLLNEYKAAGKTFSEVEVLQLLRQVLPVLAHLHAKGIIHRDISPDNIILRNRDRKPVLIDFGIVKELATRFQSPDITHQPTTVGKLGYAPSEQIQTGRAYPNSDLYSLAVTAIVLLTGREAQELFDDTQLSWNWQRWVTVSPEVAAVLNKMLSYKPSDRYQTVVDVAKALPTSHNQNNPQLPNLNHQTPDSELSQINTIAVGRPNLIVPSLAEPEQTEPVISTPTKHKLYHNPWAIAAIGTVVAVVFGTGSLALVTYIINQRSPIPQAFPSPLISATPTPLPTPTASVTPTPTPTPTPDTVPVNSSQRLNLLPGESTSVQSSLNPDAIIFYTFSGVQGQQLSANLEQEGVLLTVLGPNQEPIDDAARQVTRYQGTLPLTGEYSIKLNLVQGVGKLDYKLNLRLENPVEPTPTPTPTPTLTPTPTPTFDVEQINFNGETTKQVSSQTTPQLFKRYLVNAQEGQELSVAVAQGSVTLDIRYPDGQLVEDASKLLSWQTKVSRSGEYQIDVMALQEQAVDFTLDVSLRDLE